MNAALLSSDRMDWETPDDLFQQLNREFGFTVDVCALPHNSKCERYFTPEADGLAQDWSGETCWMNPPYGRAIAAWMKKAHGAAREGAIVVCLVPSRTDTAWWHEHAMGHEIRYIRGRVTFVGAEAAAPFPCAVIVMRPEDFEL